MTHRAFDGYTSTQTSNGVDGYATAIRAQNATGTGSKGGDLILASGSGVADDGYISFRSGNTEKFRVSASGTTLDGYLSLNALSIDGYIKIDGYTTIDGYEIIFDGYAEAPRIHQLDMPIDGLDGYSLTISAQNSTVTPAHGGNLVLQSGSGFNGDGYFRDGYVQLYSGSTEQARIVPSKFYAMAGQRVNISHVGTTPFDIPDGYYAIMVDTSGVAVTLNLPIFPVVGDTFQIKDRTGNANTNNITIYGGVFSIDASSTRTITANYGAVVVTFNGISWSIIAAV